MENNNSNEPIIMGELKKEKSSRPIFVIFLFMLLIGIVFGLPYIKDYISNNDNLLHLHSNKKPIEESITCIKEKESYKYSFYEEKLTNIKHTFSYDKTNEDYNKLFAQYNNKNKNFNNLKQDISNIEETDLGFEFNVNINLQEIDVKLLKETNDNYFDIDEKISLIRAKMQSKGYNCV